MSIAKQTLHNVFSDYVEYAGRGDKFYIGVLAEPENSQSQLMVTTDDPVVVQFRVLVREPLFERNATAEYGSVTSITLPPTLVRGAMGISVLSEPSQQIGASILNSVTGITQVLPCEARNQLTRTSYQYHLFPLTMGVYEEQPLVRSMLLVTGCQDTTNIQVFSTHTLSLPVDVNRRINILPSGQIVTSFSIDQMETVAISTDGDFLSTYVTADKMVSVSLESECSGSVLNSDCRSKFVQISPSFAWGRTFFISSRPDSSKGAQYMIQSGLSSSTRVTATCRNGTYTTYTLEHILGRNTQYVFNISSKHYCSVSSSEQIQVIQYDPRLNRYSLFQLLVPPVEQYSNKFSTIPLYPPDQETNFIYYLTIFVPMYSSSNGTERKRVMVDGRLISEGWNTIYCSNEKPCGYGVDVMPPLQSTVNVTHEDLDTPLSVIVHGIGTNSFSTAAGLRLNDLTGQSVHTQVAQ